MNFDFFSSWKPPGAGPFRRIAAALSIAVTVAITAGCGGSSDDSTDGAEAPEARATALSAGTGSTRSTPFGSTAINLAALGYTETEYFVSGKANRYRITDPLKTADVVDGGHPYTTRILVRRPKNPSKFNGTVVVEWLNVTVSQDVDFVFAAARDHLLSEGYTWVGVSAQLVGTNALTQWNPTRYASINITASNTDPAGGTLDATGDVLSWDIFANVGRMLRNTGHGKPLAGLRVERVIAAGESQSAGRLTSYYNSIQPLYKNIYDGFIGYDAIAQVRRDLDAKIISIRTEFGLTFRPGDLADGKNVRYWELAGASHVGLSEVTSYLDPQIRRNGLLRMPDGTPLSLTEAVGTCSVMPLFSRVPNEHVVTASVRWMHAWLAHRSTPPASPRVQTNADGTPFRDAEGRVLGGIRLAAYDAPMAVNVGVNSGPGFCILTGYHLDFTPAQMCARYGSRANYLSQVLDVTRKAERSGFILKVDAERTVKEAASTTFSCP